MDVRIPPAPGSVPVRVRYRLRAGLRAPGIPVEVLLLDGVRPGPLTAEVDGSAVPVHLREVRPGLLADTLPLPPPEEGPLPTPSGPGEPGGAAAPPPEAGRAVELALAYEVTEAGGDPADRRIVLPLPVVEWLPEDPGPGTFVAEVHVPPGTTVVESFPTSVLSGPEPGRGGILRLGLQGPPSALVFRVREGRGPLLTLPRMLDVLVLAIFGVIGAVGWRHLRGEEARRAGEAGGKV